MPARLYMPPTYLTIRKFDQDFHKQHSPQFSLTVVLPTYIGGPNILPLLKGVDSLSFSQGLLWKTATDSSKLPDLDWPGWVDVRDVAKAHINALVTPEAAGKRWIVSERLTTYSEVRYSHDILRLTCSILFQIADIVRRNFPSLTPSTEVQTVSQEPFPSGILC
jgi:hypothetical protein